MSKYRFDQIAINSTAKKKPTEEDKYHYIGLEHIDSQNLIVSRWGSEVAPKGDKLLMKKGDVLFGKRRAYQKKVAIAPFDGIFSAHGMVLRPNEEVVDKDFFPMFISSDYFLDAAIAISVGSLSPTINWKDLARLEFDLPPMEEQKKLAEVLWSINDTLQAYQNLLTETDALVQAQFVELFGDPVENPMKWPIRNLSALGTCKNGMNFSSKEQGIAIRCVGVADIKDYNYIEDLDNLTLLSLNEMPSEEYLLRNGDIVFVRSNGNKDLVGRCVAVYPGDIPVTFSGFCIRFRKADEDVLLDYLLRLLKLPEIRAKMAGRGANIQNLNQKILASLPVPIPPKNLQETYIQITKQSDKAKSTLQNTITSLQATKRCILEDALGTGRKE